MKYEEFEQLFRDYKLLATQLAKLRAEGTNGDPDLINAMEELTDANLNLSAKLEELRSLEAGIIPSPRRKPNLRIVK